MAFNSMSSRSFRELVLTRSIMEFFGKPRKSPEPSEALPDPSPTENPSPQLPNLQFDQDAISRNDSGKEQSSRSELTSRNQSTYSKEVKNDGQGSDASTQPKEGEVTNVSVAGDPFTNGDTTVEYKQMFWWQAGMVMVAETVSLGILALPQALSILGMIPGILLLLVLGAMASYTGYVIGQFKIVYPGIHSMADAGELLLGRWGYYFFSVGQTLFFIFVMASHILAFSIMMNAITDHATCTIVFMVMGAILSLIFTLPRTLRHLSYYSISSFISILGAVLVTMIGVSIRRPAFTGIGTDQVHNMRLWPDSNTEFHSAFLAAMNMVFAYAGHVAFFAFISEMKNPKDFPKALAFLQISDISMYLISAIVIYYFAGTNVTSPALDSAGPLIRKIAYGIAIPTIVIAGVVNANVAIKFLYALQVRRQGGHISYRKQLASRTFWFIACLIVWTIAWIIAEGVPRFNDLLGLTSALFASWFTFGLSGIFWGYLNLKIVESPKKRWWLMKSRIVPEKEWAWRKTVLLIINLFNILVGFVICVVGLYAGGKSISITTITRKPFSCADNSG